MIEERRCKIRRKEDREGHPQCLLHGRIETIIENIINASKERWEMHHEETVNSKGTCADVIREMREEIKALAKSTEEKVEGLRRLIVGKWVFGIILIIALGVNSALWLRQEKIGADINGIENAVIKISSALGIEPVKDKR